MESLVTHRLLFSSTYGKLSRDWEEHFVTRVQESIVRVLVDVSNITKMMSIKTYLIDRLISCKLRAKRTDGLACITEKVACLWVIIERSVVMSMYVCLSVCLPVPLRAYFRRNHMSKLHKVFCACSVRSSSGGVATDVMNVQFCGWCIFSYDGPSGNVLLLQQLRGNVVHVIASSSIGYTSSPRRRWSPLLDEYFLQLVLEV